MKLKYYIILIFLGINLFSQSKINIKEQCKLQYDSEFKNVFGDIFFKKNIKFNKEKHFLSIDTVDINSDEYDTFITFFVNKNNTRLLKKLSNGKYFDYTDYYNYNFLYKGKTFYERTYRCEFTHRKEVNDFSNKEILEYYNKIKNKEYLSPKRALKIAKANGLKNICYQSLTSASFHNKNQDVWQIEDCSNEITGKVIELDPRSGKVLSRFERDYGDSGKAAYWNLFNKDKKLE